MLGLDARRQRREIKSRIGVVPQETNLDGDLTVRENLIFQARYFGIDVPTRGGAGGRAAGVRIAGRPRRGASRRCPAG